MQHIFVQKNSKEAIIYKSMENSIDRQSTPCLAYTTVSQYIWITRILHRHNGLHSQKALRPFIHNVP